jgi:MFS family permease
VARGAKIRGEGRGLSSNRLQRLGILWMLYFVQGLPFGFQATALPVYLRAHGASLEQVGLATLLALPWMLKLLWAPLVDGFGSSRFGRRRSWIVPLQAALAAACALAALVPPARGIGVLLALVLAMNLLAATMDIAVDGLAVDLLERHELGHGNVAQVVGYKMGMLTGGGLLVWASGRIGWEGLFLSMALLVASGVGVTLIWRERGPVPPERLGPARPRARLGEILGLLRRQVTRPAALWLLVFVATYKLGETMADTMFKPFLHDAGFAVEQIGLYIGTLGMLFSIAGSIWGGWLATRLPLLTAVGVAAALRAVPVAGEWWLALVEPSRERVLLVTSLEHFFGGALTTALFAYMMSRVDRRIGATNYTLLASLEVWGKIPAGAVSGFVAGATSYAFLFGLATVLSLLYLLLLLPLRAAEGATTSDGASAPRAGRGRRPGGEDGRS